MTRFNPQDKGVLGRFGLPLLLLGAILLTGTIGYWFIGGGRSSVIDALYMTVITIATIGYGEVIDLSGNPGGRVFTMFVAFFGIGVLAYIMSSFTALIVEGELTQSFRRRRMEHAAQNLKNHYIVCGRSAIAANLINELRVTDRPYVVIETDEAQTHDMHDEIWIHGDASDNATLLKAGIGNASGLFAVTDDDNLNVVVCLSARQLNPKIRIVAQCANKNNTEKLKKAGADAVVLPSHIGGLRMASEMIRPTAVSFLDTMLRDSKTNLRVEESPIPAGFEGKPMTSLKLGRFPGILLLAIKKDNDWVYNPSGDYLLKRNDVLVFMTTPKERQELLQLFENV